MRDDVIDDVIVLTLVDVAPTPAARAWGYARFVAGRFALRGTPGLSFAKVLGSGKDGGFGLKPSASRMGLFCIFSSEASADDFIAHSSVSRDYRDHAREHLVAKLRAYSSKGAWSGRSIAVTTAAPASPDVGPIASLTRASIKPQKAASFWALEPAAERGLNDAPGCLLSVGIGEAPVFRQATFSVWANTQAMDGYARSGAHLAAIRAAYGGDFFSESAFVRMTPLLLRGTWKDQRFNHEVQLEAA